MNIRRAEIADAAEMARLTTELGYPSSVDALRERLSELLARETQFIAVAVNPEGVGAWVAAEDRLLLESGRRAELVGLVVSQHLRRNGLGRRLVAEAEAWARSRGLESIFVRSNVIRVEAHTFYERLGYTHKKTQHAYFKPLMPESSR